MLYSIEKRVCANLINRKASKKSSSIGTVEPLVFVLNTTESHSESGAGARMLISEQHQAFVFDKSDSSSYRTVPIQIQNIASINLRRNGDNSRPHDQAGPSAEGASDDQVAATGQESMSNAGRCMPVKFDDPQMKVMSEQIVTHLVEAYKGVQTMCDSLNVKLKGLVDTLDKQELALMDSIEPTMPHDDETAKLDSDERSALWKAKLGEIYREAIMKCIADELSF